jgi:hypothetical protein
VGGQIALKEQAHRVSFTAEGAETDSRGSGREEYRGEGRRSGGRGYKEGS